MCDRQHTIVGIFDPKSPRITAYHIHEWLHEALRLQEDDIRKIQIDGAQHSAPMSGGYRCYNPSIVALLLVPPGT